MANKIYERIDVNVPNHQYPLVICNKGLENADFLNRHVESSQVMIVTNTRVGPLYLELLKNSLADKQCDVVVLPDGEEHKNQNTLNTVYDALIEKHHHRDTTLIALGGGVVGDIAGYAASTYQRGVALIQIPTTLLAQIDASVGGKTAINHPLGKNLIGTFYQPKAVLIDISTLPTLPLREFRAGLAEMIKYALLTGGEFLARVESALQSDLNHESADLPYLIGQCCRIKAEIVAGDEKETGSRALLNLGHTFGHALEAQTHYEHWLHGEAVAIGLYCAAILSWKMGLTKYQLVAQVKELLELAGLPYAIPHTIDLKQLIQLMKLDKKIKNNRLRFVVIKQPGECELNDHITEECLHDTLIAAVKGE